MAGWLSKRLCDWLGISADREVMEQRLSEIGRALADLGGSFAGFGQALAQVRHERERETGSLQERVTDLAHTLRKLDDHVRNVTASRERQQVAWMKDIGRTVAETRSELRLLTEAPSVAGNGPRFDILQKYIETGNIRELYPTDLFPELEQIQLPLGALNEESGHTNQVDLLYVVAIAAARHAKSIFEFGTYQGRTTYHLTFASPETRVFTLNLPPHECPDIAPFLGIMFKGTNREKQITQILESSATFDPTPFAGQMDFVFIDADHSYEMVKNDTEKALTMLKPNGAIVWHDFAAKSPGVVKFIYEFSKEHPVFYLKHTCLIVYIHGVDAMTFKPRARRPSLVSRSDA